MINLPQERDISMNNTTLNTHELKEAITEDIETLKTLEVGIMPAHEYYKTNIHLFLHVFFKIYGTILLGLILPVLFNWHEMSLIPFLELLSSLGFVALLALGLCIFAFLFIYSSLNHYVLINHQLKNKLKTGELLVQKIRMAGTIAYRIFAAVVLIPSVYLYPGCALFLAFGAFFVSGIVTTIIVEMELNRIGISTLFTLVKNYFENDKKQNTEFPHHR